MIILLSEMREFLMLLTGLFACACGTSELARDVVVNDSVDYLGSRPRDATSVATKKSTAPSRNSCRARRRYEMGVPRPGVST